MPHIAVWRDALLNLAYEYEMPNVKKCPLVKTNKLAMECEASAIMCVKPRALNDQSLKGR